ncbi:MAG TPA: lipopolysaccharide transport periplasmic protein LptA [Macromonas sp.]|nr:lipopolysaccharide transport periplasmic protein LptA [Macromonas sp.]
MFTPSALLRLRRPLLAWLAGAALALPVWAERADKMQPMNIESDALRYDDARQVSVFTGHVVITKGSIVIRGQQVEVKQDPQGYQFGTVLAGEKPAFFRQKREGRDEFIEGEAQRIDYDGLADIVTFTGNAVLRRYKDSKLNDQTNGTVIVYDNRTDVFTVDSGKVNRTANNPSGRVRAMLTPTPAPGAPAAPATGTPPVLQPSTRLESRP